MHCQNCNKQIKQHDRYYRGGRNGTPLCSKECAYDAYEGFYSRHEVMNMLEVVTKNSLSEGAFS